MKKIVTIAASALLITALLSTGTLAYFTAQGKADNVITSGSISMKLHDETTGQVDFPKEGKAGVVPGDLIDKCVYVENTGKNPLYARIKVDKVMTLDNEEKVITLEGVVLNINNTEWTYSQEKGFYYYNRALKPGEKTPPLFTTVSFGTEIGNKYQNAKLNISVSAQAVQSQNNTDNPLTANGWPNE